MWWKWNPELRVGEQIIPPLIDYLVCYGSFCSRCVLNMLNVDFSVVEGVIWCFFLEGCHVTQVLNLFSLEERRLRRGNVIAVYKIFRGADKVIRDGCFNVSTDSSTHRFAWQPQVAVMTNMCLCCIGIKSILTVDVIGVIPLLYKKLKYDNFTH